MCFAPYQSGSGDAQHFQMQFMLPDSAHQVQQVQRESCLDRRVGLQHLVLALDSSAFFHVQI